jgi:3-hydroxyisobutyrate dehydrogenase-like beta-hydroxyacid dehydrogenase
MPDVTSPAIAPVLALIGFGEAGSRFARAGQWHGRARGWDIKPDRRALMAEAGVATGADADEALAGATLVLSLVTADAAVAVAQQYAHLLPAGTMWCDMNSVAPHTKRAAAEVVEEAGGHYVDVAVMAPVGHDLNVPLLVCGPHAAEAEQKLLLLGFSNVSAAGGAIGKASAIKLCRSIMVKEALTAEMVMAASSAGVLDEVLASLDASEKQIGWRTRADYNLDRMLLHGRRRSAEMAEASEMIRNLGISPMMTDNTVNWQQGLGELDMRPLPETLEGKTEAIRQSPKFKGEI